MSERFGEMRSVAQQAPSVARDRALCRLLRDSPRAQLARGGMIEYLSAALFSEPEQRRWALHNLDEVVRRLQRGELFGEAARGVIDLRGCLHPTDAMLDWVVARTQQEEIVHLLLDDTGCGDDWLAKLMGLGRWEALERVSVRSCQLGPRGFQALFSALPTSVEALDVSENEGRMSALAIVAGVSRASFLNTLKVLRMSGCTLDDEDHDALARRASRCGVRLWELDVSRCERVGDDGLLLWFDSGVMGELRRLGVGRTRVSEFGLAQVAWGVSEGALERLGCGEDRHDGEGGGPFSDEDGIAGLFGSPGFAGLRELELGWSLRRDGGQVKLLEELVGQGWWRELSGVGLWGAWLDDLSVVSAFSGMRQMSALGLRELWSEDYVTMRHDRRFEGRKLPSQRRMGEQIAQLCAGLTLRRVTLGLAQDRGSSRGRLDRALCDDALEGGGVRWMVSALMEGLALERVESFAWYGKVGLQALCRTLSEAHVKMAPRELRLEAGFVPDDWIESLDQVWDVSRLERLVCELSDAPGTPGSDRSNLTMVARAETWAQDAQLKRLLWGSTCYW